MSNNKQPQNNSEEVDLGQLFRLIGKAFDRLINFIASIFKWFFSLFVYSLKALIVNFKIILIAVIIAGVLGYALDKYKPKVYSSEMLVKPNFDSKYQLINTIDYYNALIVNEDYNTLSNVFQLNQEDVIAIRGFEINYGPETENYRIVQYNNFLTSIDSTRALKITFDDFIENRSIYSVDIYEIKVFSSKKDVFRKLEGGIAESFTNEYSKKKMKKRDSLLSIQKENIIQQLAEVAQLQGVYMEVLKEESKSSSTEVSFGGEGLSLNKDKTETREFELLGTEIKLRNQLKAIDEKKVEEDVFFDVISSFQEVGNIDSKWYKKYQIVFPALAFILLCVIYLTSRMVTYVKKYEV